MLRFRTKRSVAVRVGEFGVAALEQQARLLHAPPEEVIRVAALHYLSEASTRPLAGLAKRFGNESPTRPFGLELDPAEEPWNGLGHEALRQGLELENLIAHALYVYLADFESGRLAELILERAESLEP